MPDDQPDARNSALADILQSGLADLLGQTVTPATISDAARRIASRVLIYDQLTENQTLKRD